MAGLNFPRGVRADYLMKGFLRFRTSPANLEYREVDPREQGFFLSRFREDETLLVSKVLALF